MKRFVGRITIAAATIMLPLFLLLIVSPSAAMAQEEAAPEAGGQNNQAEMVRQLNLTPQQVQKIREIRESNKEERRAINQRLGRAQFALERAIYYENADEAVIEDRLRELGEAQRAAARMRALTELNIRRVLTPEQINTLRTLREQAAIERNRRLRAERNQRREGEAQRPGRGGNQGPVLRPRRGDSLRGRQP